VQFQFVITLFTALVAAFFSTIVSQPGDTLFTALTKSKSSPTRCSKSIYEENDSKSKSSKSIYEENISKSKSNNNEDNNNNDNATIFNSFNGSNIDKVEDLKLWAVLQDIVEKDGLKGLFVGMQARLLHVSFFVSVQLLVYDYVKQLCGIPATGLH